ncbi:sugar ABC transporter permease [Mollicutes bacterium LVI A0078]|nr:sugar ABC transporter permease [Mollicutes bacterium LVI A0075]WOO90057.1 sugar ABC transporter permease [Mollicutes bacterium LVI A0078]
MQLQKTHNSNIQDEQTRTIKQFLFVPILLVVLFTIIPFLLMVYYSFTDWDGFSTSYNFIGLENYKMLFTKDNIEPILVTSYYLFSSFFQLLFGIYLAVYVFFQKRFKAITISILLLPVLLNTVAIGLMFRMFFMPGGTFDITLDALHIIPYISDETSIKWLGNADIVNWTLAFISFWRYTSYTFILVYGALLSIDPNLLKAAHQVGANKYYIARYILIPNIKVSMSIVITTLVIGALSTVELPMIMTSGALSTKTVVMRIQEVAFSMRNFGLASSLSLFVIFLIAIIIGVRFMIGGDDAK